jgi:hypothetical protein
MLDFFVPHGLCIGFSWDVHSAICSIMLFLHGLPLIKKSNLKPLWIYDVHIVCVMVVHEMMVMPIDPLCFLLDDIHLKKLWWHTVDRKFCFDTIVDFSIQVFFCDDQRCHFVLLYVMSSWLPLIWNSSPTWFRFCCTPNLINWVWRWGKHEEFLNIYNLNF